MWFPRAIGLLSVLALSGTTALAQWGLYGSPEMLNLPRPNPAVIPSDPFSGGPAISGTGWLQTAGQPTPSIRPIPDPRFRAPAEPIARPMPIGVQAPGNVGQMFDGSDPHGEMATAEPFYDGGGPFNRGMYRFNRPMHGRWRGGTLCDTDPCAEPCGVETCCPTPCSPWYGSVAALFMTRDRANALWTSYEWNNEPNQLTHPRNVGWSWRWGGEVRIGRRFNCSVWALEATYWTINGFEGMLETRHVNHVGTPLTVSHVLFNGQPATNWFDNATAHRLWRRDELHSLELNLVNGAFASMPYSTWDARWSVGFRYFRFEEQLIFGALSNNETVWGVNPAEEAYFDDQITNSLVGLQVGGEAGIRSGHSCRFFFAPKLGVYNNFMDHYFQAYLGDGTIATPSVGTGTYPVRSSESGISFLTQLDLGMDWMFATNWSFRIGYRVMAVTGMALADHQFPHYIVAIDELQDIDSNGHLILHGGYLGLTYNF